MTTVTRRREGGTMEHHPKTGEERINAFRQIVNDCAYAKIDGTMVDLFTASCVVQIYDTLSEQNQMKYAEHQAHCMAHLAFKFIEKSK
jgi:23S rRNA G2069 N7-methylase RlmK/C1962 C5-methylase RlmI